MSAGIDSQGNNPFRGGDRGRDWHPSRHNQRGRDSASGNNRQHGGRRRNWRRRGHNKNRQDSNKFTKFRDNSESRPRNSRQNNESTEDQSRYNSATGRDRRYSENYPESAVQNHNQKYLECENGENRAGNGNDLDTSKEEILNKSNQVLSGASERSAVSKYSSVSSSSSDSDSESADSVVKDLKKAVNESVFKKTNENKTASKKVENRPIKQEKEERKQSSSTSSDSSDSEVSTSTKQLKREKNSEDEVVCLGRLENIENLVDDEEQSQHASNEETCLFCDGKGHTSFQCFMVCKNCGEKYHGLKDCLKPANVSVVLQNFMEFCLNQFYQYSPEQRFLFSPQSQTDAGRELGGVFNVEPGHDMQRKCTASSSIRSSPELTRSSRKRILTFNIDSSSDESDGNTSKRRKSVKRKHHKPDILPNNSYPSFPFNSPFPSVLPFPFNPQGIPYTPQGVAINPVLPYAQMMGFNPINFPNK